MHFFIVLGVFYFFVYKNINKVLHLTLNFYKTMNSPESCNKTYNDQFYNRHPPTYIVVSVLKETQA